MATRRTPEARTATSTKVVPPPLVEPTLRRSLLDSRLDEGLLRRLMSLLAIVVVAACNLPQPNIPQLP